MFLALLGGKVIPKNTWNPLLQRQKCESILDLIHQQYSSCSLSLEWYKTVIKSSLLLLCGTAETRGVNI